VNRVVLIGGTIVVVPLLAVLLLNIKRDPRKVQTPMIGRAAPPFTLPDVHTGEPRSLAAYRGKPVVVNFWASWCQPCYAEHEALVSAARAEGDDVRFVGVVYEDTPEMVKAFLERQGRAYPSVMDPDGRTAIAYGIFGVPETFFVDAEGIVVGKFQGPLSPDTLAAHLREAKIGAAQLARQRPSS
jgi:cytochrome c biogenesis protein CcmG/thiol:disulfide interchange protein DsbE